MKRMGYLKTIKPAIAYLCVVAGFFILLTSCNQSGGKHYTDNPTSGNISISSDESYKLVLDSQLYTFQSLYEKAHIQVNYGSEAQAIKDLLNDSVRLVVISRELNDAEKEYFKKIVITPRITRIAIDAIAIIVNNENKDTSLSMQHLKAILEQKISTWKQLDPASELGNINVVFDNDNSGNARLIKEKLLDNKPFPGNCFAVKSNPDVIDYVNKNKNAIGVISVCWISDRDDPKVEAFLKKIKVVELSEDSTDGPDEHYKPYQGYIAQGVYPLCRNVYTVSREARAGLGTGFVSFVAGDKGQRIFLKAGLVPATMPVRIIKVN
jgi:phosphate transport system substrate-binding protein